LIKYSNEIPYRGYAPNAVKKHATDSGGASKDQMVDAAREKFDVEIINDDHADTLHLLDLYLTETG